MGVCRVLAPVTRTLAETTGQWARAIAPVVENVAAMLAANSSAAIERLPTPLTQTHRSTGRDAVRRKPTKSTTVRSKPAGTCPTCGGPLPNGERQFCDDCLPVERQQLEMNVAGAGVAALAKMRAEGREPWDSADMAQARRGQRAEATRGNRMGSDARQAGPGDVQAGDTAAAYGRVAVEDEGGDGAIRDDVRADTSGVCAAPETLGRAAACGYVGRLDRLDRLHL
jgi:hypothetical protein